MLLKGGWHGTACVHVCCSPFSFKLFFFKSKKSVFVCEIPLERGGFSPLGTGMSWESSQWNPGKSGGKTKCMRTMPPTRLAEPLGKGQPAKQGSRGGCTCNSRHPTHHNNNKMGGVMMMMMVMMMMVMMMMIMIMMMMMIIIIIIIIIIL